MNYFSSLFEKKNIPQLVLCLLFIIYLVMGFQIPQGFATIIDSTIGKIVIVIIVLMLFAFSNPVLGVLGLLVAYQLIKSASIKKSKLPGLEDYYPTQAKVWSPFTPTNQFPHTLEEEVVKNMTVQRFNTEYVKAPFSPILNDTYDAAPVNSTN